MENLRNNGENSDLGLGAEPDYVAYEDDVQKDDAAKDDDLDADDTPDNPPPAIGQDERRMHVRAYNFWAGLLGERQFPNVEDLNPETDNDFGPNSVLLDFTDGVENPTIQFLGQSLREECDIDDTITSIDQVPSRSLLSRITDHYLQIIANQAPIGFEAEFVNQRGITIMYRGILLPFSTDDDNIDFIYGVINWKEVAADAISVQLEDEIAEAMRSAPSKKETGPVWADGPTAEIFDEPKESAVLELTDTLSVQPAEDASLADWLSAARNSADNAAHCEQRSRTALYEAIGQAYDFYLMTNSYPEDYQTLLQESGLKAQERAPMTPIVKLVFGVNYDKTRLTEYASALRYASQHNIGKGDFSEYLAQYDGGLKAVVHSERGSRNSASTVPAQTTQHDEVLERLRSAPSRELHDIDAGEAEFIVLVARKDNDGNLSIVGPVLGDQKLTNRVLRKTSL